MTRKHFQAIADAVVDVRTHQEGCLGAADMTVVTHTLDRMSLELADVCGQFNANFDRDRFLKACGVQASLIL